MKEWRFYAFGIGLVTLMWLVNVNVLSLTRHQTCVVRLGIFDFQKKYCRCGCKNWVCWQKFSKFDEHKCLLSILHLPSSGPRMRYSPTNIWCSSKILQVRKQKSCLLTNNQVGKLPHIKAPEYSFYLCSKTLASSNNI